MEELKNAVSELIPFLSEKRIDLREVAVEGLMGFSADIQGRKILEDFTFIPSLVRLFGDSPKNAKNSLLTLLNLSIEPFFINKMLETKIISNLIQLIKDKKNMNLELCTMLLCNLTRDELGCKKLLQVGEEFVGFQLSQLIDFFVFEERINDDPLSWISIILMNVTQLKEGRMLILNKEKNILPLLLPFTKDSNVTRRKGILGVIKNCCFERDQSDYLLSELNIIPFLLYPLRGPTVLSDKDMEGLHYSLHNKSIMNTNKKMEEDEECAQLIIDSFLLLATTIQSRDILRASKVYPIIRDYHKHSLNEQIQDSIHHLVELLVLLDESESKEELKEEIKEEKNEKNEIKEEKEIKEKNERKEEEEKKSASNTIYNLPEKLYSIPQRNSSPMYTPIPIKNHRVEEVNTKNEKPQESKEEKQQEFLKEIEAIKEIDEEEESLIPKKEEQEEEQEEVTSYEMKSSPKKKQKFGSLFDDPSDKESEESIEEI